MPIRTLGKTTSQNTELHTNIFSLPDADPEIEQKKAGLSFCLIMKNEERFLEQCLASVAEVADELCVVDTGSTDRSIEIAQKFGARIEIIEWPMNFAKARNVSLAMAQYRWILTLDADEEIAPESLYALRAIKNAPAATYGVMCRIQNKTVEEGVQSTFSHYLPRLFPNSERIRYRGAVHERLLVDQDYGIPMVDSPIVIYHYGYQIDVIIDRDKTNRNLPLIKKEAEEYPDDTFCIFNLAMVQLALDQTDDSLINFERMFEIAKENGEQPTRAYFAPAYVALAQIYARAKGDMDHALELLEECLEISEYYPNALYVKANFHAINGDNELARECLKKCVDAQEFVRAYAFVDEEIPLWRSKLYLSLSYSSTGEYEEALHWIERAIEARPMMWEIRLIHARTLENLKRKNEAEQAFLKLMIDFGSDGAFIEYLRCLMRLKKYNKVLEYVEKEVINRSQGSRMQAYLYAAQAACGINNDKAETYLEKAIAIEKYPHVGDVISLLDEVYVALGRNKDHEALRAWELEALPPCFHAHDFARRSARLIEATRYQEALDSALLGLKISEEDAHLLYNAAVAESKLNKYDDAISHLAKIHPYVNKEIFLTASYMRSLLLQRQGLLDAAIQSLDSLLVWDSTQIDAMVLKAKILKEMGNAAGAEKTLLEAMACDRERAIVELATLYLQTGRYEDAQKIAEQGLELQGAVV